jgi:Zn-finger nucleic acid-binding protein
MPHQTKIATCSYCGRRQTLQVTARDGHELACGACGAPLHEMKWLKQPEPAKIVKRSEPKPAPHGFAYPRDDWRGEKDWHGGRDDPRRRKKKKKRKSLLKKAFEEAFDVIEDIFD